MSAKREKECRRAERECKATAQRCAGLLASCEAYTKLAIDTHGKCGEVYAEVSDLTHRVADLAGKIAADLVRESLRSYRLVIMLEVATIAVMAGLRLVGL